MAMVVGLVGAVASFAGSMAQANAMKQQAQVQANIANYNAQVLKQQAQEDRAAAQRKALDEKTKAKYAQSSLQALAAASGGGAADPSIVRLGSDIAGLGEYNFLAQMYTGEAQAQAKEEQAALDIYSGQAGISTAATAANATILGGIGGLAGSLAKFA